MAATLEVQPKEKQEVCTQQHTHTALVLSSIGRVKDVSSAYSSTSCKSDASSESIQHSVGEKYLTCWQQDPRIV